jgi:hypothetical protein
MRGLYLARGHNSWTNHTLKRVFKTKDEADRFCEGLTDSSVKFYNADNQVDAFNLLLREETR